MRSGKSGFAKNHRPNATKSKQLPTCSEAVEGRKPPVGGSKLRTLRLTPREPFLEGKTVQNQLDDLALRISRLAGVSPTFNPVIKSLHQLQSTLID